ncbi:glycosyltransferase [Halalkalicoccus ordinarius]|uniref:glycosyltransferase n=1 Tax=Halalkalicoccus ordinarius TaxID=3116651 RepID=UPI00300F5972
MSEDTIDVLCLTSSMGIGGAEKQISVSSERLAEKGVDIRIVCLRPVGAMGEQLMDSQVDVVSLNIEKNYQLLYKFPRLLFLLFEKRPDIIHGHMYHSNVLSRLLSLLSPNAESVSTVHSTYETNGRGLPKTSGGDLPEVTIRERMYRATDVLSDLTTFVSESSRQRYIDINAVSERSSMVVYNGIDTQEFHRDSERRAAIRDRHGADEKFVWLAAGRFTNAKDYPTMIRAFGRLSAPDNELWILGDGELKPEVEREIQQEGVADRITLLGTTNDVPSYMSAADGFVLSSHWEGFGLVVAEAMACELPVVATRCGGPEEIVVDGETGHLCEARDPAALAAAMDRLRATKPAERNRMGRRGRRVIENRFDLEKIADQWKEIYRSLLG